MKVKILINDTERAELNKLKAENIILKQQVQKLKNELDKIKNDFNNNSIGSSDSSVPIGSTIRKRLSNIRKKLRRKKIDRKRLLKARQEKQKSHKSQFRRKNRTNSNNESVLSTPYPQSEISPMRYTVSDDLDSTAFESMASVEHSSSQLPFFSGGSSSDYVTAKSSFGSNRSTNEELSFYDALPDPLDYDADVEMTGVGMMLAEANTPSEPNTSNGNSNIDETISQVPSNSECFNTPQMSSQISEFFGEALCDGRSFYRSGVSNLDSYHSFAANRSSMDNPSIFLNRQSTPCFKSLSNVSDFECSTIPNSPNSFLTHSDFDWSLIPNPPTSRIEMSHVLDEDSPNVSNGLNESLNRSTQSIFQFESFKATNSLASQAEAEHNTQGQESKSESESQLLGSIFLSLVDNGMNDESSPHQSGATHSREEPLTELRRSKRIAEAKLNGKTTIDFKSLSEGERSNTQAASRPLSEDQPAVKKRRFTEDRSMVSTRQPLSMNSNERTNSRASQVEQAVSSAENVNQFSGFGGLISGDIQDSAGRSSIRTLSSDERKASNHNAFNTTFMRAAVGYFAQRTESMFSITEHLPPETATVGCICCLCKIHEETGSDYQFCVKNHPLSLHCEKFKSETLTVCSTCMTSMTINTERMENGTYRCCFNSCLEHIETIKQLEKHYFDHLKVPKFKCVICSKGFSSKPSLKSHERSHIGKVKK